MGLDPPAHALDDEQRRRRDEVRARWEREHHHREAEAQRVREVARHRPARVGEPMLLPPSEAPRPHELPERTEVPPVASMAPEALVVPDPILPRPEGGTTFRVGQAAAPPSTYLPMPPPTYARPRAIGGAVGGTPVESLLQMDGAEHFDLEALNVLPWSELARELHDDVRRRREVREKLSELLARVKQETDEPTSAGSLVRSRVVEWYRRSPADPAWAQEMPARWGGTFADSREAGGRLHPWLLQRMHHVLRAEGPSPSWSRILPRRLSSGKEARVLDRAPGQLWAAEVAQALLDDLASHARDAQGRLALVRLSELAGRRTSETVNEALATLLSSPPQGPFVLLHPNRYPDCDLVVVRPPTRGSSGATLSYVLQISAARPSGLGGPLDHHGGSGVDGPTVDGAANQGEASSLPLQEEELWTTDPRSVEEWKSLLAAFRKHKHHLPAPPKDFRQLGAYRTLRELLLHDEVSRANFLATKWRGRPAGLALLMTLLKEGTFSPEASTDYEYLDSELGDVERGDPERHPEPPRWSLELGEVTREGDFSTGYRYRLERKSTSA